jgi:hypothetical protein
MRRILTASAVLLSASLFSFGQTVPVPDPGVVAEPEPEAELRARLRWQRITGGSLKAAPLG